MNHDRPDVRHALLFGALWAAEEALTGLLLARYGLAQIVWMRFATHLLIVWLIWGRMQPASLLRTRRPLMHLVRAAALVAMPACWALGMRRGLPPATLMSVFWLAPVLILAMARLLLRERVVPRVWGATALASIGVFVVTGPHRLPDTMLLIYPLGMAMSFSVFLVLTRMLRHEPEPVALTYLGLGVCVLLAPFAAVGWTAPRPTHLLVVGAIALVGIGALLAMGRLVAVSRLSRSAPMAYLQIPFAMALGWWLGVHAPGWEGYAGLAVVLLSVLLAWSHAGAEAGEGAVETAPARLESRL
ncbi:DMT family transporter [Piscinibacter aquaticus]|uniref:DMT family transporter n=1 Tax=Piscinibacter aquaticus TaxID=392597 RepID=A0A5C6TZK4_9BURK|nr:DMT family transporter [Piscinibacter aquaticus]